MSYQPYASTDYPAPTPPAPPKKRGRGFWILIALAGVLGLVVLAGVAGALLPAGDKPPAPSSEQPVAAPPVEAVQAGDVAPKLADIKLTPKVIDRECFGSAGCNVTLRVDMELTGAVPSTATSWLVVYEIRGVEDGPLVGNLTLTGSKYVGDEENVQTTTSKAKITVKVVSVDKA